jgi:hypothetical protein
LIIFDDVGFKSRVRFHGQFREEVHVPDVQRRVGAPWSCGGRALLHSLELHGKELWSREPWRRDANIAPRMAISDTSKVRILR